MGYVRLNRDWRYNECRVLRLESDCLCLEVLPEVGGKIYRWIYKKLDRDYLWQHPRIPPRRLPPGTGFDDTWCGGWDDLFPSDSPCRHEGETYPDHGEYWTQPFDWEITQSGLELALYLRAEGPVTPTRMERWITLEAGSPVVRLRHRLTHLGEHAFDYLWKLHPALATSAQCEIVLPAGRGIVASPGSGRLAADPVEFTWPNAPGKDGSAVDLSRVPASSGARGYEMVYLTELHGGWLALLDHSTRSGFGLAYDRTLFNNVWLFASYGGWRGLHVAVPEPSTAYPYDLAEAASSGRVARLQPGHVVETEVVAVVFTDRDRVEDIAADGTVR